MFFTIFKERQIERERRETYITGGFAACSGDADNVLVHHSGELQGAHQVRDGLNVHASGQKNMYGRKNHVGREPYWHDG